MNKEKLYKMLGSEQFQKVVFAVEKIKFKLIDLLPFNLDAFISKRYNKIYAKKAKKLYSEATKKELKQNLLFKQLHLKKEISRKQNNNYHINFYNIEETKKYLENNKKIHINGLKSNLIYFVILLLPLILSSGVPFIVSLILLFLNILGTIINFECINLQNYNLERLEKSSQRLKNIQERKNKKYYENNKEIIEGIKEEFVKNPEILKTQQLLKIAKEKESLNQLRNLVLNELDIRNKKQERGGQLCH